MRDSDHNTRCKGNDKIVGYIFGELAPAERDQFEAHLEDCSSCIDELAAVSVSHFEVSEWRKAEFEPLATPVFAIPYRVTFMQRLQSTFGFAPGWLTTAGAMASLLVVTAGGVFFASNFFSDHEVAAVIENSNRPPTLPKKVSSADVVNGPAENGRDNAQVTSGDFNKQEPVDRPVTKKPGNPAPKVVRANTVNGPQIVTKPKNLKPDVTVSNPRLSDFEDDEDESLRLSDLFADIDTRD